jgi:site-specific DNA-methyltransferase (adenine-specific)
MESANISKTLGMDTIYNGNCIEYMKTLPDNSVHMICTDPPYFLDGLGSEWNTEDLDARGESRLVGNLPKGMKFDRSQSANFRTFYTEVSAECFRVLKPGGVFLSFCSPRLYHAMAIAVEDAGFEIRDMIGWVYTQSQAKAFSQDHIINKDKVMTAEEKEALKKRLQGWKTMQLKPAIEPICLAVKPVEGRLIDNMRAHDVGLLNTNQTTESGRAASNIVTSDPISEEYDSVFMVKKPTKTEKGDYNIHLSVKPVHLIEHLIQLFTHEGAVVFDPFMGSGTTAVACVHTKRHYLGCEINRAYMDIINRRISEATP